MIYRTAALTLFSDSIIFIFYFFRQHKFYYYIYIRNGVLNVCSMLHILGTPGYTCSRLGLLSQNSFENVKLPVRVENRRCNHGLRHSFYSQVEGRVPNNGRTFQIDNRFCLFFYKRAPPEVVPTLCYRQSEITSTSIKFLW